MGIPVLVYGIVSRWVVRAGHGQRRELGLIATRGLDGTARVVTCTERGGDHNYKPRFALKVEIEVAGRKPYAASKSIAVHAHIAAKLEPGSSWRVRIRPEKPHEFYIRGVDDDQLPS